MATQKEVADRAGVSMITVSRVINNMGNVKEKTRKRIEAAIKELDYHPNRSAQALHHGLLHTIALVTPNISESVLYDNYYVAQLLSGVVDKGRRRGWDVLLTTDFVSDGTFDFLRVWHQKKIDGLVFIGLARYKDDQIAEIREGNIPCVSISERTMVPHIPWVDSDNNAAVFEAVHLLLQKGHRRFAYLGQFDPPIYNPNFNDRQSGVVSAIEQARQSGMAVSLEILQVGECFPGGSRRLAEFFGGMEPRPTAIIAANDVHAMDFMDAAKACGLRCPEDYSIIGFDAEPRGGIHQPSLASFSQPLVEMGRCAMDLLLSQLNPEFDSLSNRVFPLSFREGDSVGPVPEK